MLVKFGIVMDGITMMINGDKSWTNMMIFISESIKTILDIMAFRFVFFLFDKVVPHFFVLLSFALSD